MRKYLHLSLATFLSLLFFITVVSCSKDSEPLVPIEDPQVGDSLCAHDSLYYVAAVEPTETECGCVEHFYCPQCGRCFSDVACRNELETTILWGTGLVIGAQDNFEFFEDAYLRYGYQGFVTRPSRSNFAFGGLLKDVLLDVGDKALDKFFDFLDEDDDSKVDSLLTVISNNILRVEQAILAIVQMHTDAALKNTLNQREQKLFYVRNSTHPPFMAIVNKLRGYKRVGVPDSVKVQIKEIVDDWYEAGIYNGSHYENCYTIISELLHFFNGYWTSDKTIPQLYNHFVYRGTPWSHQANPTLLMVRANDELTLAESYLMVSLYLQLNQSNVSQEYINQLNNEMRIYDAALKEFPVDTAVVTTTRWVWTYQGHDKTPHCDLTRQRLWRKIRHFNRDNKGLEDKLTSYENKTDMWWNDKNNLHYFDELYQASTDNWNHHGLTLDQQKVIYEYYATKKNCKDYYQALTKAGFYDVTPYSSGGRLLALFGKEGYYSDEGGLTSELQGVIQRGYWFCTFARPIEERDGSFRDTVIGGLFFRHTLTPDLKKSNEQLLYREMKWKVKNEVPVHLKWLISKGQMVMRRADVQYLSRTNEDLTPIDYK